MVTPIDAVRFDSSFGEAELWPRTAPRQGSSEYDDDGDLGPARGAILGLVLGSLMWVGLIAGARAILGF